MDRLMLIFYRAWNAELLSTYCSHNNAYLTLQSPRLPQLQPCSLYEEKTYKRKNESRAKLLLLLKTTWKPN